MTQCSRQMEGMWHIETCCRGIGLVVLDTLAHYFADYICVNDNFVCDFCGAIALICCTVSTGLAWVLPHASGLHHSAT